MTLTLFAYVATAFTVNIPWSKALLAAIWPHPTVNADYFLMVVAVLGTTISPYLFFWQASQEVEEMNRRKVRPPLRDLTRGGLSDSTASRSTPLFDDLLQRDRVFHHPHHRRRAQCQRSDQHQFGNAGGRGAAGAGRQFHLFPVRARHCRHRHAGDPGAGGLGGLWRVGSVGWPATLEAKAPDAVGFYTIIAAATVIGFGLGFTGIDAIHMLVWSAVLNGIVAVPIMAMMMVIVANATLMGRFRARPSLIALGWIGTALMALAVVALFGSFLIG